MFATDTNCPAVTATPESASEPAPGTVVILTLASALAPATLPASVRSVNPKSAAVNVYTVSSSVATVLLVPAGASLTEVTLTVMVRGVASRSTPPLATPPSSCTWNVNAA